MKAILFVLTFWASALTGFAYTGSPKDVKCPIDDHKFTVMVTGSYTTFGAYRDFQKYGAVGQLYENMLHACPKCHYSGYVDYFDTTYTPATVDSIREILEPFRDAEMNDVEECLVTARLFLYFKKSYDNIANLYLMASYHLKGESDKVDLRKDMQRQCIGYLQKALEVREYEKKETHATIYYLLGELYRRVGDFDRAVEFLDKALKDPDKADWIKKVAKEQRKLAENKDDDNTI